MKLSEAQRRALTHAVAAERRDSRFGALPRDIRSRMGGAYRRMLDRLADRGLLTKGWPYKITPAGLRALQEDGDG